MSMESQETVELINNLSNLKTAWLSGLWEGEGWFTVGTRKYKDSVYKYPMAGIQMTDDDVIDRACKFVGKDKYTNGYTSGGARIYRLLIVGKPAIALMRKLYPFMGNRRKNRIIEVLRICDTDLEVAA